MSQQPKLTLEYFPMPGRAEPARAMFWIADIPFEDKRVAFPDFGAKKAAGEYPLGQLPVLYVDGKAYPQSVAIHRYAARVGGFYPTDPLEQLKVDALVDTIWELINAVTSLFNIPPEKKEEAINALYNEKFPLYFGYLEKAIKEAEAEGRTFLVGDKISVADISAFTGPYLAIVSGKFEALKPDLLDKYPTFVKYIDGLKETDEIKKYLAATAEAQKQQQ